MNEVKTEKIKEHISERCTGCGRCCRDTVVPITIFDLKRLVKATGRKAENIIKMYDEDEVEFEDDRDGWVRLSAGMRFMGLRKDNDRCLFLNAKNMCDVYPCRPQTCRTFPLQMEFNDNGRVEMICFIDGVACERVRGETQTFSHLRQVAQAEEDEDERYHQKVREWNRRAQPGGKKEFLKYFGVE